MAEERRRNEQLVYAQEQASARAVHQISKACPNCKRRIEKRGGCDHMTCKCGVPVVGWAVVARCTC